MKKWLTDWPAHPALSFLGWVLIGATGGVVIGHMIAGHKMPDGYGDWYLFLGALSGINVTALGIRRVTDIDYQTKKTEEAVAKAAVAGVAVPVAPITNTGAPPTPTIP